jgi:hypothetical protein
MTPCGIIEANWGKLKGSPRNLRGVRGWWPGIRENRREEKNYMRIAQKG